MEIKAGRKFKSKYGHIKVEVLFIYEEGEYGGVIYKLSENDFINGCSTDEFRRRFKPITTHEVFRVWKFLEDDTLTYEQKENSLIQIWPQEADGKTLEEMRHMFISLYVKKDWFVEEEVDEWWWTKEGTK